MENNVNIFHRHIHTYTHKDTYILIYMHTQRRFGVPCASTVKNALRM